MSMKAECDAIDYPHQTQISVPHVKSIFWKSCYSSPHHNSARTKKGQAPDAGAVKLVSCIRTLETISIIGTSARLACASVQRRPTAELPLHAKDGQVEAWLSDVLTSQAIAILPRSLGP